MLDKNTKKEQRQPMFADTLYDLSCERAVIGTLIKYNWAYTLESTQLTDDLFGDPLCKACMKALRVLNETKKDFSEMELMWQMNADGQTVNLVDLLQLIGLALCSSEQYSIHVGHLVDLNTRRNLVSLGVELGEKGNNVATDLDEILGVFKSKMDRILCSGIPSGTSTLTDALEELQHLVANRQEGIVAQRGTLVGFPELDDDGGLMPGQLMIVAGATSHGKSALALSFVKEILKQKIPIAYFSLEMGSLELASRLVSMESGVASSKQIHPSRSLEESEYIEVAQALGTLERTSDYLHFDDKFTANIDQICGAIRSMHHRFAIRGVFIDYLQILNSTQNVTNREQFMGEVARRLKNLAVELGIWVVTLSQFNRSEITEEPTLNRLRDSGQIAEAADRVMLIHRPEANGRGYYGEPFKLVSTHRTALLNLAKNRNGSTSRFIVDFIPERTLFVHHEGGYPQIFSDGTQPEKSLTFKK